MQDRGIRSCKTEIRELYLSFDKSPERDNQFFKKQKHFCGNGADMISRVNRLEESLSTSEVLGET